MPFRSSSRVFVLACAASLLALPAAATAHHSGPGPGPHLPAAQQNLELVGELEPAAAQGPMVDGQIADLAVHEGHAYLNSWDEPSCTKGGTYIVDITNPASPQEIGFLEAADGYYHGEGAHVVSLDTPQFTGDLLAVNDEACSNAATRPPAVPAGAGGFDLYDVTDPANPELLVENAGDRSPDGSLVQDPLELANSYHSVFVWQDGPQAFLVGVDNTELADVDIYNITDPTDPELIADLDLVELFPGIVGPSAHGDLIFNHDMVVKRIGAQMRMLVSYWDAGYVQLDVTNPANPTLITDTDFPAVDPLTDFAPPEGNAHQAEYSHDNEFFLAADEDFDQFRLTSAVTEAPFDGVAFDSAVSAAEPIESGSTIEGDTEFVGEACAALPAPTAGVTIAVAERGTCSFQVKIDAIEDAGYDLAVIMNGSFHPTATNSCETLINMQVDPATVEIPAIFVGRADGFRILGTFDEASYQCTGVVGPAPDPGDDVTPAPGTGGLTIEMASEFDGWGYAHLYDADTSEEIDSFAIPESLNSNFATNFGDLSIHEFATDPDENLAYSSYYSGGVRVFMFGADIGLQQTGVWIDDEGSNFWGIEQFTTPQGEHLLAGSDRDFGLQILRYTGPHPAGSTPPPGPPPATPDTDAPETTITKQPKKKTQSRTAKFKFESDELNSTFECKLDKRDFKPCESPFRKRVGFGKHKFKVRAIDAAGNVDASAAVAKWKVQKG